MFPVLRTPASGQVVVSGPTCVIPGTVYQYVITGPWDSTSTMQICLTGGQLADSSGPCTPSGGLLSFVWVTWNSGSSGSVLVQSSKGNDTIGVTITSALVGGVITDSSNNQQIAFSDTPAVIKCSPSTGGSCTPQYSYQWQQSSDQVSWSDMAGDTTQNLTFSGPVTQTFFIRRKVTETGSNTITFSSIAVVYVGAPGATN